MFPSTATTLGHLILKKLGVLRKKLSRRHIKNLFTVDEVTKQEIWLNPGSVVQRAGPHPLVERCLAVST